MAGRQFAPQELDRLAVELRQLRQQLLADEAQLTDTLDSVHPRNRPSARNLVHYLSLRRHDMRELQLRLARAGLSSLGRSEAHVLVTIDRILAMLALAQGATPPDATQAPVGFRHGERILAANTRRLLGAPSADRAVRITPRRGSGGPAPRPRPRRRGHELRPHQLRAR